MHTNNFVIPGRRIFICNHNPDARLTGISTENQEVLLLNNFLQMDLAIIILPLWRDPRQARRLLIVSLDDAPDEDDKSDGVHNTDHKNPFIM